MFTICSAILFVFVQLFCVRPSCAGNEAEVMENPKVCKACGMDRTVHARSRMLIVYADGTTAGVCSLHCAAEEMKQSKDKQVKSIMVADYATTKLIDAKSATWVMGGSKAGVIPSVPKWAFVSQEDAQAFVKENGGRVSTFDEALKAAEDEVGSAGGMNHGHMGHDMSHMDMGAGSQMLFNPAFGDPVYHTHPAGMWMVNYDFMHMDMDGLRSGTTDVSVATSVA